MHPRVLPPDAPDIWLTALPKLRNTLAIWDRWCADDGRPEYALQAVTRFLYNPTRANFRQLQKADTGVQASLHALHCVLGRYPQGHVSWLATSMATCVHSLCISILYAYSPEGALETRYWRSILQVKEDLDTIAVLAFPDR